MPHKTRNPASAGGAETGSVFSLAGEDTSKNATTSSAPQAAGPAAFYDACTIKRARRSKATINLIRDAIRKVLEVDHPQTVRQIFYALTVLGVIKKAEEEYQRTVIRLLVEMREKGKIPFGWIADNTRWMRKPSTFTGLEQCLKSTEHFYRRNLWAAMPVYVEV